MIHVLLQCHMILQKSFQYADNSNILIFAAQETFNIHVENIIVGTVTVFHNTLINRTFQKKSMHLKQHFFNIFFD